MFANALGDLQGEVLAVGLPAPPRLKALDICLRCCKEVVGVGGNGDAGDGMGHCRVGLELLPPALPHSSVPLTGEALVECASETSDPGNKACAVCTAAGGSSTLTARTICSEGSEAEAGPDPNGSGPSCLLTNVTLSGGRAPCAEADWKCWDLDLLALPRSDCPDHSSFRPSAPQNTVHSSSADRLFRVSEGGIVVLKKSAKARRLSLSTTASRAISRNASRESVELIMLEVDLARGKPTRLGPALPVMATMTFQIRRCLFEAVRYRIAGTGTGSVPVCRSTQASVVQHKNPGFW
ncbi:hypothetical protein PG997_012084 [Apiospora hydei]|uniref:Uncharacterized protein n=1 Tax=Apiospora hydei TaxID=1337664 RepID=A0ABR1V2D9_9PEZI